MCIVYFMLVQIVEAACDLLKQSQEGSLTSLYFYNLSEMLDRLLFEVKIKCNQGIVGYGLFGYFYELRHWLAYCWLTNLLTYMMAN